MSGGGIERVTLYRIGQTTYANFPSILPSGMTPENAIEFVRADQIVERLEGLATNEDWLRAEANSSNDADSHGYASTVILQLAAEIKGEQA